MRRQQHKVLPASDLDVDILVVVLVQGRRRQRVADPEVDGFRFGFFVGPEAMRVRQSNACPGDGGWYGGVEGEVFLAEVVVFF